MWLSAQFQHQPSNNDHHVEPTKAAIEALLAASLPRRMNPTPGQLGIRNTVGFHSHGQQHAATENPCGPANPGHFCAESRLDCSLLTVPKGPAVCVPSARHVAVRLTPHTTTRTPQLLRYAPADQLSESVRVGCAVSVSVGLCSFRFRLRCGHAACVRNVTPHTAHRSSRVVTRGKLGGR